MKGISFPSANIYSEEELLNQKVRVVIRALRNVVELKDIKSVLEFSDRSSEALSCAEIANNQSNAWIKEKREVLGAALSVMAKEKLEQADISSNKELVCLAKRLQKDSLPSIEIDEDEKVDSETDIADYSKLNTDQVFFYTLIDSSPLFYAALVLKCLGEVEVVTSEVAKSLHRD